MHGKVKKGIRREIKRRVIHGAVGESLPLDVSGTSTMLLKDGTIETIEFEEDHFYSCGCPITSPLGGICKETDCHFTACGACFRRCEAGCFKPLCPQHVFEFTDSSGERKIACADCRRALRAKRLRRFLLSLIIDFEGS